MIDIKQQGKNLLAGLALMALVIFVIRFFELVTWQIAIFLSVLGLAFQLYFKSLTFKSGVKSVAWTFGIVYLYKWLGNFGVWGYVASIVVFLAFIFIKRWKQYKATLELMQKTIWGDTFKNFKERGEQIPKLKFGLK